MADASTPRRFGFIGLGVMGEPMCRNLARKGFGDVVGHDRDPAPLQRLAAFGVAAAATIAEVVERSDVIFLALPSGAHVEAVCDGPQGLLSRTGPRHVVVDLGTSPVDLTRALAGRFAARGVRYADAPIARTRQAAEDGTLSIMVGADATTFAAVEPLLRAFATDICNCHVSCARIAKATASFATEGRPNSSENRKRNPSGANSLVNMATRVEFFAPPPERIIS